MRLQAAQLVLALASLSYCPFASAEESMADRLSLHITRDRLTLGLSEQEARTMCDEGCDTGIMLVCKEMRLQASSEGKPQIEFSDVVFRVASKVEGRAAHLRLDCEKQTIHLAGTDQEPVSLRISQGSDDSKEVKLTATEVRLDLQKLTVMLQSANANLEFPITTRSAPSAAVDNDAVSGGVYPRR